MIDVDVIVVGAGPVGLLLAAELATGSARVVVVERLEDPSSTVKAGSINVASAELLARRGLLEALRTVQSEAADRLEAGGAPPEVVRVARRGVRAAHFAGIMLNSDLADQDDPRLAGHQDALDATFVSQRDLESVLAAHAAAAGVCVRRGVSVTGVDQADEVVTVHTDAGPLTARWVVGCDGGRSVVRRAAAFQFPGSDAEITGRQAFVELVDDAGLQRGWQWGPGGVFCYGPMPGRIVTVEFDGPPADRDAAVTREELQGSLRRVTGVDVTITEVRGGATRWTDNARQATNYRQGRVLLAGDAAHVHSPFSGQGLNLGLGDAMNLGWKLAAVVAGRSPSDLLDTYTAERHPVGEWVLNWTRAQVALMRSDPKTGCLRDMVTDLINTTDGTTQLIGEISGVTRRLPLGGGHPMIGRTVADLTLQDGRPLHEAFATGKFVYVATSGSVGEVSPWSDRVEVVRAATTTPVLVRPDGVIVWASSTGTTDGLTDVLEQWAGRPLTDNWPTTSTH